MRKILSAVIFALCWASVAFAQIPPHTRHNPNISSMSAIYGAVNLEPRGLQADIEAWMGNSFDYDVSYSACPMPNGHFYCTLYIEASTVRPYQAYAMQTLANRNGWVLENMFLHGNVDLGYSFAWSHMDQFDAFDRASDNVANAVNGVLTYDHKTYTDVSVSSYDGASVAISNMLYVGFIEPFDQMNFVIATARVGGSVSYQYWNGAWSTLKTRSDGTSGLTVTGTGEVYWYPPSDWTQRSVNGSNTKYWVRVVVSGQSRSPVYSTLKGDNIADASGGTNGRGWDGTQPACPGNTPNGSSCIINAGTRLAYNANPPAASTAHFRWQSRATDGWAANYIWLNPVDKQSRKLTIATWLETLGNGSPEGVMLDDLTNFPIRGVMPHTEVPTQSAWLIARQALTSTLQSDMHAAYGSNFSLGGNTTHDSNCYYLNWCFEESVLYSSWALPGDSGGSLLVDNTYHQLTYDAVLPANGNTNNTKAYFLCYESTTSYLPPGQDSTITTWHYWDRGNRGPMNCLAQHYMGWNGNAGISYHTQGAGFFYALTDEVWTYAPATTITADLSSDTTSNPKKIFVANASGCLNTALNNGTQAGLSIGANGDTVLGTISGTIFTTIDRIYNAYPSGTPARCIKLQHQSQLANPPPASTVYAWATWFPALGVDIGAPDPNGYNAGTRTMPYKTGGSPDCISGLSCRGERANDCDNSGNGNCASLHRRDFTKAIVLYRDRQYRTKDVELDTYSRPIPLGGAYYPLKADGTTAEAVTSIELRGSESVILMKSPVNSRR